MASQKDLNPIAAFTLVAPKIDSKSGLVARAVMPQGVKCPSLMVTRGSGSERKVKMTQRRPPSTTGAAFVSLISCTANIPVGATSARIGSTNIPAEMPTQVKRMAIFGDTGCRLKVSMIQDCSTSSTWPLAQVATSIAADRPDLIVFTGDFFYRETSCPAELADYCGGSPAPLSGMPFKDSAYSWSADVFVPMSPLFSTAPILVARGNHEACNRGGNGYFIYMDPRAGTEGNCAPYIGADGKLTVPSNVLNATYAADVNVDAKRKLRFVVVDSAYGEDCEVSNIQDVQRARYEKAQQLAKGHTSWLLVHRPIVGWQPSDDCSPTGGWVSVDQSVASYGLLSGYQMMLSSHVHVAQAVNIPGIPGQLVVGNGGALLEPSSLAIPQAGPTTPGATYSAPTSSWMDVRFGYVLATPKSAKDWTLQMRDPRGKSFANCNLRDRTIACKAN